MLGIAEDKNGRLDISGALDNVNRVEGWDSVGILIVGHVFCRESGPFESGVKTSLSHCTRFGGPLL